MSPGERPPDPALPSGIWMSAPQPPGLCSTCGRDLPASDRGCGCLGPVEAWEGGERVGLWTRRWRTPRGAEATVLLGRLQAARGHGRVSFPRLLPAHYGALRGDVVLDLGQRGLVRDPPVDALLAALVGGAAREVVALRGVRELDWFRRGMRLRLESTHAGWDDVSVERLTSLGGAEDRVLAALWRPRGPSTQLSEPGYRGEPAGATLPVREGPLGIVDLLRRAIPADDLAESWLARHAAEQVAGSVAERTSALLAELWRDEVHADLVEELTRHLRFAFRTAITPPGTRG